MEPELFPGEKRLHDAPANLLIGITLAPPETAPRWRSEAIVLTAQALASFLKGSAIGGWLMLTNYRFYFSSHAGNTTRGACSLFLPTLVRDSAIDGFISDTLTLETGVSRQELVVRNAKKFREALAAARSSTPTAEELAAMVRRTPKLCGSADAILGDAPTHETLSAKLAALPESTNALDVACALNVAELLEAAR